MVLVVLFKSWPEVHQTIKELPTGARFFSIKKESNEEYVVDIICEDVVEPMVRQIIAHNYGQVYGPVGVE